MSERAIAKNELLCLRHAAGCEVRVRAGVVWLTEAGQPGDIFLRAGQCYRVRGSGLLVGECLTATARVEVRRPGPAWLDALCRRRGASVLRNWRQAVAGNG